MALRKAVTQAQVRAVGRAKKAHKIGKKVCGPKATARKK